MKQYYRTPAFWTVLAAVIPSALYLLTLCPTVYCGDSGELALAAAKLQIAHPPGYPLLTNLGSVWASLWFFARPILALNLLAALFAAATAVGVFLLLNFLTKTASVAGRIINLAMAVTFALGQTLWSAATSFEVYSLGAALMVLILTLLIRFYHNGDRRFLLLASYLFGLALCNHLSASSLGVMLAAVAWIRRDDLGIRDWLFVACLIALPLTFYGYLYVRSSHELILDWYDPQTLWGLKQHLFAKTYQRYLATFYLSDLVPYGIGLARFLSRELVLPFTALALPGAYVQFRRDRSLALLLLSVVIVNCGLNFNYLIPDIAPYFMPTIMVAVIWMAEFLQSLAEKTRRWPVAAIGVGIAIAVLIGNYGRCDISDRNGAELYAKDLFERVPVGGTLLCGSDNSMFPTLYLRYAENYRSDCRVYGHLPTLTRLRDDMGLKETPGYNRFPDLVRHALTHTTATLVFSREPMQSANDFQTLEPSLVASGLVCYADSSKRASVTREYLDWRHPPELHDSKEALLYIVYQLINGEELSDRGDPQGERFLLRATELVRAQGDYSMVNELSGHFVLSGNLRLARRTLEEGLTLPQLRLEHRQRLLESLGSVVFESGDEKRATELFQEIERMDPKSAVARYHLLALKANEAVRSNRLNEAIGAYRQMLEVYPQQREVNLQLGLLLLRTGDTTSARAMFDICLRDNYKVEHVQKLLR